MSKRGLYLAAYDVRHPRRLRHALEVLKHYATGGQKSVFECYLTDTERGALLSEVKSVLNLKADRFMLVRIDPRSRTEALGIAVRPADPDFFYVG